MSDLFSQVTFVKSAPQLDQCPDLTDAGGDPLPEIAVVGRSNVGKSSLLNNLFRRKNLVKTSSTPGKTQLINFFLVGDKIAVVDLPGYGYAKVSKSTKRAWGKALDLYLQERKPLSLILFLFDMRRKPDTTDHEFLAWAQEAELPVIVVLTKADKFPTTKRKAAVKKVLEAFDFELPTVLFSSTKNIGRSELIKAMREYVSWD